MSDRTYGPDEKAKLERLINEGATVIREIEERPLLGLGRTARCVTGASFFFLFQYVFHSIKETP